MTWRRYRNLLITFLIGGFWHGANWTFVIWGLIHGLGLCCCHAWRTFIHVKIPKMISWGATFFLVNLAWVCFRADSLRSANHVIKKMMSFDFDFCFKTSFAYEQILSFYIAIGLVIIFVAPNSMQIVDGFSKNITRKSYAIKIGVVSGVLLFLCILKLASRDIPESPFLYFQF